MLSAFCLSSLLALSPPWHTDFPAAQAEARWTHKPILAVLH